MIILRSFFYGVPESLRESAEPDGANPFTVTTDVRWDAGNILDSFFIQTGPEGIVHTLVDGIPKLNPAAGDGWIQNSAQNIDYTMMMNGLFLETEEKSIQAIAAGYPWPADVVSRAYNMAMTNAKPAHVVITATPLTTEGPIRQTLIDKGVVIFVESITAPAGRFDAVYDAGLTDWRASGADAVAAERRAKYPN
ncbi:MAG: hypothetical protein LBF63_00190 [Treponema sp.]|jgi:putative aldouronate transport system substrate-binding protein|nr:hypothetical protein [Treponema sp.]